MGGHRHDRAGAVFHEHIIADPDGDLFAVDRVNGITSGEDAVFLGVGHGTVDLGLPPRLVRVFGNGFRLGRALWLSGPAALCSGVSRKKVAPKACRAWW